MLLPYLTTNHAVHFSLVHVRHQPPIVSHTPAAHQSNLVSCMHQSPTELTSVIVSLMLTLCWPFFTVSSFFFPVHYLQILLNLTGKLYSFWCFSSLIFIPISSFHIAYCRNPPSLPKCSAFHIIISLTHHCNQALWESAAIKVSQ